MITCDANPVISDVIAVTMGTNPANCSDRDFDDGDFGGAIGEEGVSDGIGVVGEPPGVLVGVGEFSKLIAVNVKLIGGVPVTIRDLGVKTKM